MDSLPPQARRKHPPTADLRRGQDASEDEGPGPNRSACRLGQRGYYVATAELVLEVVPRLIILSHGEDRGKGTNNDTYTDVGSMKMLHE